VRVDPEHAEIPKQTVIVLCVNCDRTREVTKTGQCSFCGSNSVIQRGALREMQIQTLVSAVHASIEVGHLGVHYEKLERCPCLLHQLLTLLKPEIKE